MTINLITNMTYSTVPISASTDYFKLVWWNTGNFFHYDPGKFGDRWPKSAGEYEHKCSRVDAALNSLFEAYGKPSILGLGEITQKSAQDLRDRLFPGFEVISLDTKTSDPTLQVAIIHQKSKSRLAFKEQPPIVVPATPRGTRPMAVLDIITAESRIRVVMCHWQARFDDNSDDIRRRVADYVSQYAYDFLSSTTKEKRSFMIVGDLNEEPFELPQRVLHAHRHRARSINKSHWADRDVKRIHLYNCSWRLLGERSPHGTPASKLQQAAGTYYWEDKHSWHHLDHVIVSGGLLGDDPPFLDESEVAIAALPEFMPDGMPYKFTKEKGVYRGLSDHLPIVAAIHMGV